MSKSQRPKDKPRKHKISGFHGKPSTHVAGAVTFRSKRWGQAVWIPIIKHHKTMYLVDGDAIQAPFCLVAYSWHVFLFSLSKALDPSLSSITNRPQKIHPQQDPAFIGFKSRIFDRFQPLVAPFSGILVPGIMSACFLSLRGTTPIASQKPLGASYKLHSLVCVETLQETITHIFVLQKIQHCDISTRAQEFPETSASIETAVCSSVLWLFSVWKPETEILMGYSSLDLCSKRFDTSVFAVQRSIISSCST